MPEMIVVRAGATVNFFLPRRTPVEQRLAGVQLLMASPELIWLAGALAVTGIALLRLSWGRPGRAAGLKDLGWSCNL